jgi:hypothetical protein
MFRLIWLKNRKMIKLSENKTALINLESTISALENIAELIKMYEVDKPGPAYCLFKYAEGIPVAEVQFDRQIMVDALYAQRLVLIDYLANLGIDAS